MFFRDIPGQDHIASMLRKSVEANRISHAQLFAGSEGSATLPMALAYAQYISCRERGATDSCGVCPSCVKYSKLIHPDLHFVFPVFRTTRHPDPVSDNFLPEWRKLNIDSPFFGINDWLRAIDVENSQAIIYAAEASEIIRKHSLKTYEGEYKIMIIWLPERMHSAAANKLLKLIEEPPARTLFLLVAAEPDKLLPTILSRCQLVRFRPVDPAALAGYLTEKYSLSVSRANEIAHISQGNIVRALKMVTEDGGNMDNLNNFRLLMRHCWKKDIASMSGWSEELATQGREAQKDFLGYCLEMTRGNFIMNICSNETGLTFMTEAEAGFSANFSPFVNKKNIERLYGEFNKAYHHIESNGNPRIIFLDLALQISMVIKA